MVEQKKYTNQLLKRSFFSLVLRFCSMPKQGIWAVFNKKTSFIDSLSLNYED